MLIDLQMKHPCLAPEGWRKGLGLKDFHHSELSSMAARLQSSPTIPSHIDPPEISRKKRAGLKLGFSVAVSQPGVALLQQCPFAAWRCGPCFGTGSGCPKHSMYLARWLCRGQLCRLHLISSALNHWVISMPALQLLPAPAPAWLARKCEQMAAASPDMNSKY